LGLTLALSDTFVRGDPVPDPVRRPCVTQLLIVETRLVEIKYLPHRYTRKSLLSDTETASQWIAENPNARFVGILTGRVTWTASAAHRPPHRTVAHTYDALPWSRGGTTSCAAMGSSGGHNGPLSMCLGREKMFEEDPEEL